ncbi:bifunctional aspartokinase/homoserine dehydrogenase LysC/ThrA [Psychroflexus torquis ATCC 700755]|uniref:Aspartokinase n=1 Tax=Psychroflexus torquis (strain ATCC 700755 / CIP 106069 / ACAM 623) TaxID=313595 RepID=K4IFS5_PSYTT|nr:aspartate kinase [Psychroflexus torquis]AFU69234.1 bifunctional aspartokinase/homoserine dehydrogenase LysC/ThrA [Psychroflexus torquis ATCC 700755]
MQVFKFGGASVKDAKGVRNVATVLETTGPKQKVVIISAMGKTTNKLETIISLYFSKSKDFSVAISELKNDHYEILDELFEDRSYPVYTRTNYFFDEMSIFFDRNKSPNYDYVYDQVVGFGELISTSIVSYYLKSVGLDNVWHDCRNLIDTDDTYRDAEVNWGNTQQKILNYINKEELSITQGFIGSDSNNFTTTLGREGSDYTAGIFAYCLNAENVTIWKDVPGVLNGDPNVFENTKLLEQISYEEAIELAFFGASVIHPKTLQPLQQKEIPLFVKSFYNPKNTGTKVGKGKLINPLLPCFIVKKDLVFLSLSTLDFSFFVEENISEVFALFHKHQVKVDLIQNSAISFSVCVDNKFKNVDKLIDIFRAKFKVDHQKGVSLFTIRHYDDAAIKHIVKDKTVLLKQSYKETIQFVTV